jgi:hypothetical protein
MTFKGNGEISKQNLCKKYADKADPIIEESLVISFGAEKHAELAGMSSDEMKRFFENQENKSFEKGKGSFIISNVFNLKIAGRHKFTGENFTSCVVKRIKDIGTCIILHCRLKYSKEFHAELPGLLNTVMDIEIKSVNEHGEVPQPGE